MSSKWLHTVAVKATWFLWGRISANWPSWINKTGGVSTLSNGRANTPTFSYLYKFLHKYYLSQPRHYYISEDKNVPLTFSSTPTSPAPVFFSPHLVTLPPHLIFFFFFCAFPISPLPLISFGPWPHLRLLIHCSVSRSIERLSVRRSHCVPHPLTHLPRPPPCLPRLQTHSLLGSWLSTSHTGEHLLHSPPPPPPFSLFPYCFPSLHLELDGGEEQKNQTK